jgi:hypothetical protein
MTITGSFQFITKDGSLTPFKTVSRDSFFSDFSYGDTITGSSYPLTAKVTSDFYLKGQSRPQIKPLKNTLNYYRYLSDYYAYQSGSGGDRSDQTLRVINIPSIFYGQSIKKGSISCKWYLTGTLIAELKDEKRNGELIHVGPIGSPGSGNVAGVVLYSEGFILLHGHYNLHNSYTDEFNIYDPGVSTYSPKWIYWFGTGSNGVSLTPSSSFGLDFEGVEEIPTLTMLTHAQRGEFNHSNNPTFIKYGQELTPFSSSNSYVERDEIQIKNIVKVPYNEVAPKFEKTVFISKVGIYDEQKNLIAIAKLATPIRKKENEAVSIKLKLDL